MATLSVPTYDPKTTASQLAQLYVAGRQEIIATQNSYAKAASAALAKLSSAMKDFETALGSLNTKTSVLANSAKLSIDIGSASASESAVAGTYSFYVEKLAVAGQIGYSNMTNVVAATAGDFKITLVDGTSITVDLTGADKDGDAALSAQEVAAAVNTAAGNNSRVTASTMTVNGATTLVFSATATGLDNSIAALDLTGTGADLAAQLDPSNKSDMRVAADAIIRIGSETGQAITQASNTFNIIDGVSVTFTKAQTTGDTPVDIVVARDNDGTAANLQSFIDKYNGVVALLKELSAGADPNTGKAAGVFAGDAGIVALRTRMQEVLRTASGGKSLVHFGVTVQRDGTLSLDKTRMQKSIALDNSQLDAILGSFTTPTGGTGVLGGMRALIYGWTALSKKVGVDPVTNLDIFAPGTLTQRSDAVTALQKTNTERQATLDRQYEAAFQRYLKQFTQLQQLQSQMTGTSSMFDAIFASKSSS